MNALLNLYKLIVRLIVFCLDRFPSGNALRSLVLELHWLSCQQSALLISKTYSIVGLHDNYLYAYLFCVSMSVVYVRVYTQVCAPMHKCAESRRGHRPVLPFYLIPLSLELGRQAASFSDLPVFSPKQHLDHNGVFSLCPGDLNSDPQA